MASDAVRTHTDNHTGTGATVAHALAHSSKRLATAGIEYAAGDARRLLAAALAVSSADLIRNPARTLSLDELTRLEAFVRRRMAREPVSRILGEREFYGRPFQVTAAVLDPRPDTETLITTALAIAAAKRWHDRPIRILDLGTGSGAILLTLLAEMPTATGLGVDISDDALACARANATALGLDARATLQRHDITIGFPGGFDLVVSNPPYIPAGDIPNLDPEVARFDPELALDGGPDGLGFYRTILGSWAARASEAGQSPELLLEIGAGQADAIRKIAIDTGAYKSPEQLSYHRDLGGHIRCVAIMPHPMKL